MEKNDQTQAVDDFEDIPEELKEILDALIGPRYRRAERMASIGFILSMGGYMLQRIEGENVEARQENFAENLSRSLHCLGVSVREAEEAMDLVNTLFGSSTDEFHWTPEAEDE